MHYRGAVAQSLLSASVRPTRGVAPRMAGSSWSAVGVCRQRRLRHGGVSVPGRVRKGVRASLAFTNRAVS